MEWGAGLAGTGALVLRELVFFAATGFLVLGLSDLFVDLIWLKRRLFAPPSPEHCVETLPAPETPGPIAIFIPAWDESAVIAAMLRHALETLDHPDFAIYVGCYPNDPATVAAVRGIADPRLRLALGPVPGPTTKADCLNRIHEALLADEARTGRRFKAVVLHDAEDVVHSAELRLFDALIGRFDLVQIPVLPLIDRQAPWISGHYADEFAESHGKELVVRQALGAALPAAGVGCAISRDALEALAAEQGQPFDPASLTEDYEMGLRLAEMGRAAAFVRLPVRPGGPPVATRAFFPTILSAAVAQKARWTVGIALSGWDRLGWRGGIAERWMRMRDRQSLLAALLLCVAYAALLLWLVLEIAAAAGGTAVPPLPGWLSILVLANSMLLAWRAAMRFGFVARAYGWREGVRSVPRMLVGNAIAILSARRAIRRYLGSRRSGELVWDKTGHVFPDCVPAE